MIDLQRVIRREQHLNGYHSNAASPAPLAPLWDLLTNSLIDAHERKHTYLRISLTDRCNLRCRYCMPPEGIPISPKETMLSDEEIMRLSRLLVGAGVQKIRLTGGEPLLRVGVEDLIASLAVLPGLETIGMTTNALLLPRRLPGLKAAGLTALNISLDTLQADRFEMITRRRGLSLVLDGIDQAIEMGFKVKVNTVVIRGVNDDELNDLVAWIRTRDVDLRFIEFMPFGGNGWGADAMVSGAEMREIIGAQHDLVPLPRRAHDVARLWQVPGSIGRVGFISSMSDHFCGDCNRLRLTADGNLKVCLHDRAEISLRDAMREEATDAELLVLMRAALLKKKAAHADAETLIAGLNRPMVAIGG